MTIKTIRCGEKLGVYGRDSLTKTTILLEDEPLLH